MSPAYCDVCIRIIKFGNLAEHYAERTGCTTLADSVHVAEEAPAVADERYRKVRFYKNTQSHRDSS